MDDKHIPIGKTSRMLGVSIKTLRRWDKSGKFIAVRHSPSGNRYYLQEDIDLLLNDPTVVAQQWAFNSRPKFPEADFHCKTRDVFQARLESFQDKILKSTNDQMSSLITAIAGEIGNNSFDHNIGNWPDIPGTFFSSAPNRKIALADRGQGILSTLGRVDPALKTHAQALIVAFTKTISARPTEARGNGLKFVRNVVTSNPFKLSFQTGNALLELSEKENLAKVKVVEETIRGCFAIIEYYKEVNMHISIKKFGTILVSRPTGKEAYLAFQPTLENLGSDEAIVIDFDEVKTLTPSWADEFLTPLFKKYTGRVSLVNIDNSSVVETLRTLQIGQ